MKKNILRGIITIMLVLACMGVIFGQGLYWESTTIIPVANGKEIHSTLLYRPQMFRQESENQATIFRLDKEMIYQVDKQKKEYSEMTFAEFEAFAKKTSSEMDTKMSAMKKQLEGMPPEQRKMMEKMMGGAGIGAKTDAQIDVMKTTEKKTINGYSCIKYAMQENGKEIGSVWTTTAVPDFNTMQKDIIEFAKRMAAQMPMKGAQIAAAMMKIGGFAIQTTIFGVTTMVTKLEKKSIPASEFEIPAGYKKVDQQNIMGQ
jgi:GLPGLI family protein